MYGVNPWICDDFVDRLVKPAGCALEFPDLTLRDSEETMDLILEVSMETRRPHFAVRLSPREGRCTGAICATNRSFSE
jgi:hypothetical protein